MYKSLIVCMALLYAFSVRAETNNELDNCAGIQYQAQENQCYQAQFDSRDKELNKVYSSLTSHLKSRNLTDELKQLRMVQASWITFKDKSCNFESSRFKGGSLETTVKYRCLSQETLHRAKVLNNLLNEYERESRR